jgi:hypothetical protein
MGDQSCGIITFSTDFSEVSQCFKIERESLMLLSLLSLMLCLEKPWQIGNTMMETTVRTLGPWSSLAW